MVVREKSALFNNNCEKKLRYLQVSERKPSSISLRVMRTRGAVRLEDSATFVVASPSLGMREVSCSASDVRGVMGGDVTIVGAWPERRIVALARVEPDPGALFTDISFLTGRDVARVQGDVLLYRTDAVGNLVSLFVRDVVRP